MKKYSYNSFKPACRIFGSNLAPRQIFLLRTTFLFWLLAKLISYKVWTADRFYPVVPLFDFLETLPNVVHGILFLLSIALLVFLLIFPQKPMVYVFLITGEVLSCAMDVARWQPWEYQYLFIALIFLLNRKNLKGFFTAFVFLLSLIYIFSGLHKISGAFLYATWDNMILNELLHFPPNYIKNPIIHYSGLFIPFLELVGGLGLLFFRYRKTAALILIGMHLFVLILIGPFGIDYNAVVWPWNFAMMGFLVFLCFGKPVGFSANHILKGANPIILLFWLFLPAMNFVGHWDLYLSSALYSGKEVRMDICFETTKKTGILEQFTPENAGVVDCGDRDRLPLFYWAFEEMNVPAYPAVWYYSKFKKEWIEEYGAGANFILYAYPYKNNHALH